MATDSAIEPMPSRKYGTSLPTRSSGISMGVASKASIVPRSHSRAITSAVNNAPIMVRMMAIEPGTR